MKLVQSIQIPKFSNYATVALACRLHIQLNVVVKQYNSNFQTRLVTETCRFLRYVLWSMFFLLGLFTDACWGKWLTGCYAGTNMQLRIKWRVELCKQKLTLAQWQLLNQREQPVWASKQKAMLPLVATGQRQQSKKRMASNSVWCWSDTQIGDPS